MDSHANKRRGAGVLSTLLLLNFSGALSTSPARAQTGDLLVAAAADLAPLQEPLTSAFDRATGIRVRFVVASSGMLSRQMEQGAPYDVFLSANRKYITDLALAGRLVPDSVRIYAHGRIALWSKEGHVQSLADLRNPRILHVAIPNPSHAPYGVAAREALEKQGLWKQVESRIVYGENVLQAFQYAQSGNAEVAITAWSLVFSKGGILLPENLHSPILQSGAMAVSTHQASAARRFLDFLTGPGGRKILESNGLFPPPSSQPGQ
jgi:molybdate transport system substrate-binding protein